jgi:hypothetical protein
MFLTGIQKVCGCNQPGKTDKYPIFNREFPMMKDNKI